jgi:hypothetical protein
VKNYILFGIVLMAQSLSAGGAGGGSYAPLPPYSEAALSLIVNGQYQHYSGKQYQVLFVGRHSETLEELVCYKALYDGQIWVRPAAMFTQHVDIDGQTQPRFKFIG